MRNMIFLQALLCLCLNIVMAQSPGFRSFNTASGTMGALQSMPTHAIANDFGPRYVKRKDKSDTPYDWHGGIDYNGFVGDGDNDKGYRMRAIVGGTIYAISTGSLK